MEPYSEFGFEMRRFLYLLFPSLSFPLSFSALLDRPLRPMRIDFPVWRLRGAKKVFLKLRENKVVEMRSRRKDIGSQEWRQVQEKIGFKVSDSSRADGQSAREIDVG